jgi:hypothetical protein
VKACNIPDCLNLQFIVLRSFLHHTALQQSHLK